MPTLTFFQSSPPPMQNVLPKYRPLERISWLSVCWNSRLKKSHPRQRMIWSSLEFAVCLVLAGKTTATQTSSNDTLIFHARWLCHVGKSRGHRTSRKGKNSWWKSHFSTIPPSTNGLAERAVQIFKAYSPWHVPHSDPLVPIQNHTALHNRPSELLLNCQPRSKLDLAIPNLTQKVRSKQLKQKIGHDEHAVSRKFHVGDKVYNFVCDLPSKRDWVPLFYNITHNPDDWPDSLSTRRSSLPPLYSRVATSNWLDWFTITKSYRTARFWWLKLWTITTRHLDPSVRQSARATTALWAITSYFTCCFHL